MGNPNCCFMIIAVTFFFLQPIAEGNCEVGIYTPEFELDFQFVMMKGLIFIAFLLLPTLSKACLCNGVTPATCATAPCTIQCGLCRSRCCAIPIIGREETGKDCYISKHVISSF